MHGAGLSSVIAKRMGFVSFMKGDYKMPRGKLHYESFFDGDQLIEHWKDSHGNDHMEITSLDFGDDDGCSSCGNPAYPDCTDSCPYIDD